MQGKIGSVVEARIIFEYAPVCPEACQYKFDALDDTFLQNVHFKKTFLQNNLCQ